MQVLTWELPRGSCRMPRASQAGSGMKSITPGPTTGKTLTVRFCSQPCSCTRWDLSAARAHVFVGFSPA